MSKKKAKSKHFHYQGKEVHSLRIRLNDLTWIHLDEKTLIHLDRMIELGIIEPIAEKGGADEH